jgi:hypothetical protein
MIPKRLALATLAALDAATTRSANLAFGLNCKHLLSVHMDDHNFLLNKKAITPRIRASFHFLLES